MKRYQKHIVASVLIFVSIFVPQYITQPSVVAYLVSHPWLHDLISCVLSTLAAMGVYKLPPPNQPAPNA